MREEFLYHVWKFQKFNSEALNTSQGEPLLVLHPGTYNDLSGPDFFNARIQIGDQLWAGNVEIHSKSSHWYLHKHETDRNYDNVILHVVWEHDADIFRKDESVISTLVLNDKISQDILASYEELLEKKHFKINCEKSFSGFDDFMVEHWLERLYFERLESRCLQVDKILGSMGNDWEATLFRMLCKAFGLNHNGEAFMAMASSFDFRLVKKLGGDRSLLEALFLGQAKLLEGEDKYAEELKREYDFLKHKFSLRNEAVLRPQFFRLRPDNFPNIRLAQLASLYSKNKNLFQCMIEASNLKDLYDLFDIEISEYWNRHYNFGKMHSARKKKLSDSFINLLIINCVLPVKYSYSKFRGQSDEETLQKIVSGLPVERNSVIGLFNELRPGTAQNALHSQALLELKKQYCDINKCLYCELGASLLRKSPKYV
ncbi:DUF2851 family protein [Gramella sp. KN1008]|uniref:DUF2851 family protein n=1 Tax=Gramella sp. KN1008 TaxID=2529298 RepID=UPI00103B6CD2|nr:DUF2851 family protein [Gramella sp. KN1008]TBW28354.1 DUF2851 family protein [Gramella sp. KN1008]